MMQKTEILELIRMCGIPVVKEYPGNIKSMEALIEAIKPMQGLEGFVVRWEDGSMVKIKADEYCLLHRSKDELMHEKNVISIIVEGKADDFRVLLTEPDRLKFEEFELSFWQNFYETVQNTCMVIEEYNHKKYSRKDFAILSQNWKNNTARSLCFQFFDEKLVAHQDVRKELLKTIAKNCGSQSNVDKVRALWDGRGNLKWVY